MANDCISLELLEKLLKQIDHLEAPAISMERNMLRGIINELRRYMLSDNLKEMQKVEIIQRLTTEHLCSHICDLLKHIRNEDFKNIPDVDLLGMAIHEIQKLSKSSAMQTAGTA